LHQMTSRSYTRTLTHTHARTLSLAESHVITRHHRARSRHFFSALHP
jgi:hypothetical protein